jgi:hypothetical protein
MKSEGACEQQSSFPPSDSAQTVSEFLKGLLPDGEDRVPLSARLEPLRRQVGFLIRMDISELAQKQQVIDCFRGSADDERPAKGRESKKRAGDRWGKG